MLWGRWSQNDSYCYFCNIEVGFHFCYKTAFEPILLPVFTYITDVAINAITSTKTTKEEMKLGHFTCQKLKGLSNWNEWRDAKFQQLDQFAKLKMYRVLQERPKD